MAVLLAPPANAGQPADQPRWGEWWFDSWNIQNTVWPTTRGAGVTVAVIDAGVAGDSQVLKGATLPGIALKATSELNASANHATPFVFPTGRITGVGPGNADHSVDQHGSLMAQLIAGTGQTRRLWDDTDHPAGNGMVGAGVAPQAKILPIDLSAGEGLTLNGGAELGIPAAIRWATDNGAKVINISLADDLVGGGKCPAYFQKATSYAVQHNVVVVAAAGNDGAKDNPSMSPANCPGVLTVGAVDKQGKAPPWTQRQPYVAVAAPGVDIPVINTKEDLVKFQTDLTQGTSNSSALVAGAVALVRARYPMMPARQVVQRIINTTTPAAPGSTTDTVGAGIVNIPRALNVTGHPVPSTAPNPVYAKFDSWLASPAGSQVTRSEPWPGFKNTCDGRPASRCFWVAEHRGFLVIAGLGIVLATIAAVVVVAATKTRQRQRFSYPSALGPGSGRGPGPGTESRRDAAP